MSSAKISASSVVEYRGISIWKVFIIGLGFGTTALVWTLFNIAIPVFLKDNFSVREGLIGFVMTLDNIIAFFLQPYIGTKSDKTRTRIGRRFPYIITGTLLGAFFFSLVPIAASMASLALFLTVIILLNLSMAIYRSPVVSLMPDLVPSERRSLANGIINFMGGFSAALSLFISATFFQKGKVFEAFWVSSGVMIVMLILLLISIREPPLSENSVVLSDETTFGQLTSELSRSIKGTDKSLIFMLLAIGSWFIAWNAIEAFFSLYVRYMILPDASANEAVAAASRSLFFFPIVFVFFTLIGGFLGTQLGRLLTMRIGLVIFTLSLVGISLTRSLTVITLLLMSAAVGWGLINVNSIVVVWEHASDNGLGTGLYYAFASIAAISGPTVSGIFIDFIGYKSLFPFSVSFCLLAFFFLLKVRSGEAGDKASGVIATSADYDL